MQDIESAKATGLLHLSHRKLRSLPPQIFKLSNLRRLDVSGNHIQTIPDEISQFGRLEQLWLNNNPVEELPESLTKCKRLKVLDLRFTKIKTIPSCLCQLPNLYDIDLKGCLLEKELQKSLDKDGVTGLMNTLRYRFEREQSKESTIDSLLYGIYREQDHSLIEPLVERTFRLFERKINKNDAVLQILKSVARSCTRLFPEILETATREMVFERFFELRRDTQRKQLSAEVELKLRALYYDVIDPEDVQRIVSGIVKHIQSLSDTQFLLRHAKSLLPENPEDIDPEKLALDLKALQEQLAAQREEAICRVIASMRGLYSDAEPPVVEKKAREVCALFKKIDDLKVLAADVSVYFPEEFLQVSAKEVRSKYLEAQSEDAPPPRAPSNASIRME